MPMVRAYVTPYFTQRFMFSSKDKKPLELLQNACEEIIPAGLNSEQGPLTPGSIEFIPTIVDSGLNINVIIDIEAYFYEDRAANIEERASLMKNVLNAIFPDVTFAVFPKLVTAGWSSDTEDPKFDGEMSMQAAIKRYKETTGHHVLSQV